MMTKRAIALPMVIIALYGSSICMNAIARGRSVIGMPEGDIIQRIFGNMREYIGDWAFIKGEEYYHRGLPFMRAAAFHEGEAVFDAHGGGGKHEHETETKAVPRTLYQKLYGAVKVTGDAHLNPADEKEVLPWFYAEVAFNPHDIRGYILGGFWLQKLGRSKEALIFLRKGLGNNPDSAWLNMSIGMFHYQRHEFDAAFDYFDKAHFLWNENKSPNTVATNYEKTDRYIAFDLLGDIYERRGDRRRALDIYRQLYLFEANDVVRGKIKRLENELGPEMKGSKI